MNPAAISALSVLAGSSVGALAPVLSSYVLQRSVTRRDLINREIAERQELYAKFITEAARLYADSMTRNSFDLKDLVALYALASRIRLVASKPVVSAADDMVKLIVQRYGEENITLEDLRAAALSASADPLHLFSTMCRADLRKLTHFTG